MDEEGVALLRTVEALMLEVRNELRMSRDSRETCGELDRLRKDAADLEGLRKRAADRRKRNRTDRKSRDNAATEGKPAESQHTVSRDSPATSQVVKAVAFAVRDQDQERKEKDLQGPATVARQPVEKVAVAGVKRAYEEAYFAKYRVKPVWNATVAGQMRLLVQRLGAETAAAVAAFYVGHQDSQYVRNRHPVSLLVSHYERLSTDWARGDQVTGITARLEERTAHTGKVFTDLLKAKGA